MNKMIIPLFVALAVTSASVRADADIGIFPRLKKLERKDVETQLRLNAKDANKLIDVLERASTQKIGDVAYESLRKLKNQQPKNAVVLAAFYYVTEQGLKWRSVNKLPTNGWSKKQTIQERVDREEADAALKRAAKLAPDLWLVPLNQGTRLYKDAYADREAYKYEKAMPLLKKSLQLAPKNAHCWNRYGGALGAMARDKQSYDGKPVTVKDQVAAWETAVKVDPMRGSWLGLFHIYHWELKDRENALRCKREYLKRFPKDRALNPIYKKWFASYPK